MSKTISEVFDAAAEKISAPGAWIQGQDARDAYSRTVYPWSRSAVCWCAFGAISSVDPDLSSRSAALEIISEVVALPLTSWNDAPERTQQEVVTAFRQAAALARERGQ